MARQAEMQVRAINIAIDLALKAYSAEPDRAAQVCKVGLTNLHLWPG
jgi:hypothetical protein